MFLFLQNTTITKHSIHKNKPLINMEIQNTLLIPIYSQNHISKKIKTSATFG